MKKKIRQQVNKMFFAIDIQQYSEVVTSQTTAGGQSAHTLAWIDR
jgi:hypothetical protein